MTAASRLDPRPPRARRLARLLRRFGLSQAGAASVEFVLLFPVVWLIFAMTMEAGMYSMKQVMLERGLDLTIREVRLGIMDNPTRVKLTASLCKNALIFDDCSSSLRMEMIRANARAWTDIPRQVPCIDRSETGSALTDVTSGINNELMVLRACMLVKPLLPFSAFGHALVDANNKSTDEYALSATSSYVMEPFK